MKARQTGYRCSCLLLLVFFCLSAGEAVAGTETLIDREFQDEYPEDLATCKRLRGELFRLFNEVEQRSDLFDAGPTDRDLLRPDIRSEILVLWYPILDHYLALDALGEKYAQFNRLPIKEERQQAFALARAAFLTQYRVALDLIELFERNPLIDTILNEAEVPLGLPAGVYAQFKFQYLNIIKAGHYAAFEAVAQVYGSPGDADLAAWAGEDSQVILQAGKGTGPLLTFRNGLQILGDLGESAWFPVQKGVAEWLGQTKVWRVHRYLISPEQIESFGDWLQPGDILLERREWYMTNVGIPGFWTHAALYIGSGAERAEWSADPEVEAWLNGQQAQTIDDLIGRLYPEAFAALQNDYRDGNTPRVIEALSPGVILTSLEYSARCDSLAVLRPRLAKKDRVAAVVRAMSYFGRPYDYRFDFASDQSLVCTELVVKAYLPGPDKQGLDLPLTKVMGHLVTPANGFVELYDRSYETAAQQLDLILFLDGNERQQRATEADPEVFRTTWQRPKYHILIQPDTADSGG